MGVQHQHFQPCVKQVHIKIIIRHREDESEDNRIEEDKIINFEELPDGILEEFQNFEINFDDEFHGFD